MTVGGCNSWDRVCTAGGNFSGDMALRHSPVSIQNGTEENKDCVKKKTTVRRYFDAQIHHLKNRLSRHTGHNALLNLKGI